MMIMTMATAAVPSGRALFLLQPLDVFVFLLFVALLIRQGNGRLIAASLKEVLLEKSKIVTCFNLINLFT